MENMKCKAICQCSESDIAGDAIETHRRILKSNEQTPVEICNTDANKNLKTPVSTASIQNFIEIQNQFQRKEGILDVLECVESLIGADTLEKVNRTNCRNSINVENISPKNSAVRKDVDNFVITESSSLTSGLCGNICSKTDDVEKTVEERNRNRPRCSGSIYSNSSVERDKKFRPRLIPSYSHSEDSLSSEYFNKSVLQKSTRANSMGIAFVDDKYLNEESQSDNPNFCIRPNKRCGAPIASTSNCDSICQIDKYSSLPDVQETLSSTFYCKAVCGQHFNEDKMKNIKILSEQNDNCLRLDNLPELPNDVPCDLNYSLNLKLNNEERKEFANGIEYCKDSCVYNDDTWGDCGEESDDEICTCAADSDVCAFDELSPKDIKFTKCPESLNPVEEFCIESKGEKSIVFQRKRKIKDSPLNEVENFTLSSFSLEKKRLAFEKSTFCDPLDKSLRNAGFKRNLIPTKSNPPQDLEAWIAQFQKWSHVERIFAVDKLITQCEPTQVRHMMKVIEPQFQRDFISLLPKELALQVLSYLDPKDLLRAAQTCRNWRFLCDDNLLWKEKCKQAQILTETNSDKPKRGRTGSMPIISSLWKAAYLRQHTIEMNWRSRPIKEPKILKGHDDHVITCLQFYGNRIVSGSDDNTLKVWSAVNGKCLRTLVGHTGGVWSSQMSGSIVISGSTDRTLKVWNMDTGKCIHTLQGHTSTVRCMHLHGKKVVSGSRDATLRVWEIEKGICLHVLVGHSAAVRCVQYDGKLIVSGAYDYMVKVWNPERQECLYTLQGHTNRVYSLQFDGIHVVSGSLDASIRVWDVETGSCKHILRGHQSLTSGMELRKNILVSGNADSTVKVWDISTGQCLQTLSGPNKHQSAVTCLQFNTRFVITSSDDGTVKLWDVQTGEFIRNLVSLESGGSGGVVWRIRASETKLICAVGSRNGTEETKLMVLDFDVDGACAKCS